MTRDDRAQRRQRRLARAGIDDPLAIVVHVALMVHRHVVCPIEFAGQAPVVGPYLARLLGGGEAVGVVTFARFYGLHVLLLPPATLLLIALHVYLVRKHGVAPAPGDELLPTKKFYPQQVFKDKGNDGRPPGRNYQRKEPGPRWQIRA